MFSYVAYYQTYYYLFVHIIYFNIELYANRLVDMNVTNKIK